jgi:ABC-type transporter Mla subunit MlaD
MSDKEKALEAIQRVHGNRAASLEAILEDLEDLSAYLNDYIAAIRGDISRRNNVYKGK